MNRLITIFFAALIAFSANARAAQTISTNELRELLTSTLQREQVKDRGDLELRLTRSWNAVSLPDGEVTVKVLELPASGVGANFIIRFELHVGNDVFGPWQMPVQAQIWREVWVAGSALRIGLPVVEAGLNKERRDVLAMREAAWDGDASDSAFEMGSFVAAGAIVPVRAIRLRAVLHRGQRVDALMQSGALSVTMQAEVLQDGAPGQTVRIRNARSGKEFSGKVQDEHTVLVAL